MYIAPKNPHFLLEEAQKQNLYFQLINQLNKDFALANEMGDFDINSFPNDLLANLHEKIYKLIQHKFTEYLNLLYIIDVSE